jgi:hypothetical protein
MATKPALTNDKLSNALSRLSAMSPPKPVDTVSDVADVVSALPASSISLAPVASEAEVIETGVKSTRSRSQPSEATNAMDTLRRAPSKPPSVVITKEIKKWGRPTTKVGDIKANYVKISPAIPRALKDRLDDALPRLRRDAALNVKTMEDIVTEALDAYLVKHRG